MRKYRRIVSNNKSVLQSYQISLIAFGLLFFMTILLFYLSSSVETIESFSHSKIFLQRGALIFGVISALALVLFFLCYRRREEISTFDIPEMNKSANRLARRIHRLFTDKQVTDVLKLSNSTRYGDEMPQIYVWVDENGTTGYVAIENIGNYERMDREKYEQKLSGIVGGKYKRFAVVSSELTEGDTYMLFYFEDTLTSNRFHVKNEADGLEEFVSEDVHAIRLAKDLTIHFDIVPHLSIIARTRSGKSVLAGRYMAALMKLQGWIVSYNSAKVDRYVKEYNGKSTPREIVEIAESWVEEMKRRLAEIESAGYEKYLDMNDMTDVAFFIDELANLNAELEVDKKLKKRWETAINKLTSSGASAGIHVIAISQFATKEAFLPSTARVNCSDAVIMLAGAADSGDERRYLMSGFADLPKRGYPKATGLVRIAYSSGKKWEKPHYYEAPYFDE